MVEGRLRKPMNASELAVLPYSAGIWWRMIAEKAKLPNPPTKVRADHMIPLRHNFTGQVMRTPPRSVNPKALETGYLSAALGDVQWERVSKLYFTERNLPALAFSGPQ